MKKRSPYADNKSYTDSNEDIKLIIPIDYKYKAQLDSLKVQRDIAISTENYHHESLRILKLIEKNTAGIQLIVELINENNDQQDELLTLLSEIHELAKAKSTNEVDASFTMLMKKIPQVVRDAEALARLSSYANIVFNFVMELIKNR